MAVWCAPQAIDTIPRNGPPPGPTPVPDRYLDGEAPPCTILDIAPSLGAVAAAAAIRSWLAILSTVGSGTNDAGGTRILSSSPS